MYKDLEILSVVDNYLASNSRCLPKDSIPMVREVMYKMPQGRLVYACTTPLKDPFVTLILSIVLFFLAADRFYLGDIGLAILKIISMPFGFGIIWAIVDIYLCYRKTKEINLSRLAERLI